MEMNEDVIYALLLTVGAGLATGIGGLLPFFAGHRSRAILPFSLGLSAGVMIYISFMELLAKSQDILTELFGNKIGGSYAALAFFGGIMIVGIIDWLVPSDENPHHLRDVEEISNKERGADASGDATQNSDHKGLKRVGFITMLAIGIHNFPEGIATFITSMEEPRLGLAIATAVAIHNIPEGVAVAIPIYYATRSRGRALWYTLLSGLAEPAGGVLAMLILTPFITPALMAIVLAAVAGFMVYISIDELLPSARVHGHPHISIIGFIVGMAIMSLSLILL